jgi:hypothetical protein
VYEGADPYVIAVMTTDLRTLSSGRRFIRGVSRLAYDALGKFASWRGVNDLNGDPGSAPPTDAAPPTADQQMWTPQNVPAPVAVPAATPAPTPAP